LKFPAMWLRNTVCIFLGFIVVLVGATFDQLLQNLASTEYSLSTSDVMDLVTYSQAMAPADSVGCTPYGYVTVSVSAAAGCGSPPAMQFSFPAGECVVTPPAMSSSTQTLPSSAFMTVTQSGTTITVSLTLYSDSACTVVSQTISPLTISLGTCYSSYYSFGYSTTIPSAPSGATGVLSQ
jgi:hypothetical protein